MTVVKFRGCIASLFLRLSLSHISQQSQARRKATLWPKIPLRDLSNLIRFYSSAKDSRNALVPSRLDVEVGRPCKNDSNPTSHGACKLLRYQ